VKKEENLVQEELKKQAGKPSGVPSASGASRSVPKIDTEDKKASPAKPGLARPSGLKPISTKPESESAPKRDESRGAGGLRAPSRLQKPTASSGLSATEQRKQRVLEKQKAVNAKLEEKAKQGSTVGTRPTPTPRTAPAKEPGATTSRLSTRPRVGGVTKPAEEAGSSGVTR
jgi:hypothetical protein